MKITSFLYVCLFCLLLISCTQKNIIVNENSTSDNQIGYLFSDGFKNIQNTYLDQYKNSPVKISSPNNIYTAITIGNAEYLIIYENDKEIFRFKWNDLANIFTWSDTIQIIGWSSNSNLLWFISWTPTNIAYISYVDTKNKICKFYESPCLDRAIYNYSIDYDRGIFYYSDKSPSFDLESKKENDKKIVHNYVYDLFKHQIFEKY